MNTVPDAGTAPTSLPVPRLRGQIHLGATIASLVALGFLVSIADSPREMAAAWIYGLAMVALYFVSSTYHVFARGPRVRPVMRRLDHSMIFVLIAGTYTPVCLLALHGFWGWGLLVVVWAGAITGIVLKVAGLEKYRKFSVPLYMILGWLAVIAVPELLRRPGLVALAFLGGVIYTVGAVLFALHRPGPQAKWFGYHEWWHSFVVAAGACFFVLNAYIIAAA